jgi:hypothetical protein
MRLNYSQLNYNSIIDLLLRMIVSKDLLDEEIRKIAYEGDNNYIFLKQ